MTGTVILAFLMTLLFLTSRAQTIDSIEAKANYGSPVSDVQLLMKMEYMDYYKIYMFKLDELQEFA